jgi:hypothetical protein
MGMPAMHFLRAQLAQDMWCVWRAQAEDNETAEETESSEENRSTKTQSVA